jgi:hypothetical protein
MMWITRVIVSVIIATAAFSNCAASGDDGERTFADVPIEHGWGAGRCVEDDYCVTHNGAVIVRVHTDIEHHNRLEIRRIRDDRSGLGQMCLAEIEAGNMTFSDCLLVDPGLTWDDDPTQISQSEFLKAVRELPSGQESSDTQLIDWAKHMCSLLEARISPRDSAFEWQLAIENSPDAPFSYVEGLEKHYLLNARFVCPEYYGRLIR